MWSVKADEPLNFEALWTECESYLENKDPLFLETLKEWHNYMVAGAFDAYDPQSSEDNRLELCLIASDADDDLEPKPPHFWLHGPMLATNGIAEFSLSAMADAMEAAQWDGDSITAMEAISRELCRMVDALDKLIDEARAEEE